MTEKKQENFTNKTEILTIWIGQLLVFGLKADIHDMLILKPIFYLRAMELLNTQSHTATHQEVIRACDRFCKLLGERYSWDKTATDFLSIKTKKFCDEFESGTFKHSLAELRVVEAWSGLSSCLIGKLPMPWSLLDCIVDVLLPILGNDLLKVIYNAIDKILIVNADNSDIKNIDSILALITKRFCFNSNLDKGICNELKLVILLHLPKIDEAFTLKTGYVYKLLQTQYSHEEDA